MTVTVIFNPLLASRVEELQFEPGTVKPAARVCRTSGNHDLLWTTRLNLRRVRFRRLGIGRDFFRAQRIRAAILGHLLHLDPERHPERRFNSGLTFWCSHIKRLPVTKHQMRAGHIAAITVAVIPSDPDFRAVRVGFHDSRAQVADATGFAEWNCLSAQIGRLRGLIRRIEGLHRGLIRDTIIEVAERSFERSVCRDAQLLFTRMQGNDILFHRRSERLGRQHPHINSTVARLQLRRCRTPRLHIHEHRSRPSRSLGFTYLVDGGDLELVRAAILQPGNEALTGGARGTHPRS